MNKTALFADHDSPELKLCNVEFHRNNVYCLLRFFFQSSWTTASIRGKIQGALEKVWSVIKTGVTKHQCELWSLLTETITVPYIKQKASQTSASGGKIYRLSHRIAYLTTPTNWNQIVKDYHRRLVQRNHGSFLLSYTAEIADFSKFSRRNERHPLIQSI